MSRVSRASSSTGRLSLVNGTTPASTSSNSLGVRQRIDKVPSQTFLDSPTNSVKKRSSRDIPRSSVKGKEREQLDETDKVTATRGRKWQRGWVKEGFRQFGEHCARNQIRTLLIDCLVMTNLFYPSLAIYLLKRSPSSTAHTYHPQHFPESHIGPSRSTRKETDHPISLLSRPLRDTFFPYPAPPISRLSWAGWWAGGTSENEGNHWLGSRVGQGQRLGGVEDMEIQMMRLSWGDVGQLAGNAKATEWTEQDYQVISGFQRLAEDWSKAWPEEDCVRQLHAVSHTGAESRRPCALLPGSIPDAVEISLELDSLRHDPMANASTQDNRSRIKTRSLAAFIRVPRSTSSTFPNRWAAGMEDFASRLDAESATEPKGWRGGVEDLAGTYRLSFGPSTLQSTLWKDESKSDEVRSRFRKFIGFFYLALVGFAGWQVSFATRVHSRVGLAITGIVQVLCSAVMSLSVLALIGWNGWGWSTMPSSVPLWSLPMVVVVVGVENMSHLTRAVFSIPFHYSVPERIGLALSKVGTRIAYTTSTNILLLALVWLLVDVRSVQEFCIFVIVVNITDWFMLHTFYLTVLSIDAQRLELADVLANVSPQPVLQVRGAEDPASRTFSWRDSVAAKALRSGTLILTLSCVSVMYYLSDRSTPTATALHALAQSTQSAMPSAAPFNTSAAELANLSTSAMFWRALNPQGWPFIRLNISPASILVLPKLGAGVSPTDFLRLASPAGRPYLPRLIPLWYFIKVVILPQAITAGSLYSLLLYLLKNAEQLDNQRNRLGRGEGFSDNDAFDVNDEGSPSTKVLDQVQVHLLPGSHTSDIDMIATSRDGSISVSIGIDNSGILWRFSGPGVGTRERLPMPSLGGEQVVAACVGSSGEHIAIALSDGTIYQWLVDANTVTACAKREIRNDAGRIRDLALIYPDQEEDDPFRTEEAVPSEPSLLVACAGGRALEIDANGATTSVIDAPAVGSRAWIVRSASSDEVLVLGTGPLGDALHRYAATGWANVSLSSHSTPGDSITSFSPLCAAFHDRELLAVGRRSGLVEVFDTAGSHITSIAPTVNQPVKAVELAFPHSTKCIGCGTTSTDGFTVISTVSDQVFVDRAIPVSTTFCRCSLPRRSMDEISRSSPLKLAPYVEKTTSANLVIPPTSGRARSTPGNSPRRSPSLLPPVSNGEFPLSSHGTRRLSAYHNYDGPALSATPDKANTAIVTSLGITLLPDQSVSNGMGKSSSHDSVMNGNPWTDMEIIPLGSINASSGKWKIIGDNFLVGLSRVASTIGDDAWDLWTLDLSKAYNGTHLVIFNAPLSELEEKTRSETLRRALNSSEDGAGGISIKAQRQERLLSLSGKASFPSPLLGREFPSARAGSSGSGSRSMSLPNYARLAYVELGPVMLAGDGGILIGLGNRMALIATEDSDARNAQNSDGRKAKGRGVGAKRRLTASLGGISNLLGIGSWSEGDIMTEDSRKPPTAATSGAAIRSRMGAVTGGRKGLESVSSSRARRPSAPPRRISEDKKLS